MQKNTRPASHWLTILSPSRLRFRGGVFLAMAWLTWSAAQAQANTYALGTATLVVGPAAGSDGVVLGVTPATGAWTNTANDAWMHLSLANQSGTGSTDVVFSYDANPGATRAGTLAIGGQTVTVTQAGSTYVAAGPLTTLVSSGLSDPEGVAVDGAGNVYIADAEGDAIKKWTAASGAVTTLVASGLNHPYGVAVDGAGNVYIADTEDNAIKKWTAASGAVTTLVASGLSYPGAVAVDGAGNVYIADMGNNAIKEWTVADGAVTTLVASGLSSPNGVAVDAAGNVYIADTEDEAIKEWTAANGAVLTLVSSGLYGPAGVAVDGAGHVYIADYDHNAIKKWNAASGNVLTLVSSGLYNPSGVAVDGAGNVYIADSGNLAIKELPHAFVDATAKLESAGAGSDALAVVLPATENLLPPFAPTSDQSWLTITGAADGVVSFSFAGYTGPVRAAHISLLGQAIPIWQGSPVYCLGTTALLEGPAAGSDSVVLGVTPSIGGWMNTANDAWLHLSLDNQSGTGSTNVVFSFDANPGATRSGTLSIAGQTLTVTQAGSTYVGAGPLTTLVSSGLNSPNGVAVDGTGNVYIANALYNAIQKWTAANGTVTTLVASGLFDPTGVAVDGAGNVYFADTDNNAIKEWTAANGTVTSLVSSGFYRPTYVALDAAGDVYFADVGDQAIHKRTAANGNVTALVSSGLGSPYGVAVDGTGNVYIADWGNNAIKEWMVASGNLITLVSSGLFGPRDVAVDGAGNVYIADWGNSAIKKWNAASGNVITLVSSGLYHPAGVALDGAGDVYIADTGNSVIKELPRAFVDATPRSESANGGNDALPVVLPATENLLPPFAPASDQSWLTITGVNNGVVNFSCTANTGPPRTGHITLLGQTIAVTQGAPTYSLGTTSPLEGPGSGRDSVVLGVIPNIVVWTNTANEAWLHLSLDNQAGTGSTNVVFSYDANPGPTRTGTLTIAGQTLTITQAGSTYVAAGALTTLVSSGLKQPLGVAVDGVGNVYIADTGNNAIKKWTAANNTVTPLVSSGLSAPSGVAADGVGHVYIADQGNNAIKEWTLANGIVTTLVASGLGSSYGVALDGAGNVYIADTSNDAIKKWTAANGTVTALVSSGLYYPYGVAVDGAGNVYIAAPYINAIKEWTAANNTVTPLVSSGLFNPSGVAVDGAGNVYIADYDNNAIKQWTAADNTVTPLVSAGLNNPFAVAVDGAGNVYIDDYGNNAIEELPRAFVDPTPRPESAAGGNDALPVVLPPTENLLPPFAPGSDQSWLTIAGITNGVVSFSFAANPGPARTAHITLLGQTIPIVQDAASYSLGTNGLLVGPAAGSDSVLLTVIPSIAPWTATANDGWLHLTTANQSGVGSRNVAFSFDANLAGPRTGTLTIAGQTVTVTQASPALAFSLGATTRLEGPAAAKDSVVLSVRPTIATWTATAQAAWLHLNPANQSGAGSANVVFSCEANPGGTRTGTLSIAGQTLTVTQAGSTYVAAGSLTSLASSGLSSPTGVAVDAAGHVYIADAANNAIQKWTAANGTVTPLVSSGLNYPYGVAVDRAGNVYIADCWNNAIQKWTAANNTVTALVSCGLQDPAGVAVDGAGNVYIADCWDDAIQKWTAANNTVTPLVSSGLNYPFGVAVDEAGNVYIADSYNFAIKEWTLANGAVASVVGAGLNYPTGVAVDGAGNVYIADCWNNAIKKWTAASNNLTTLAAGLNGPGSVAVDGSGNVYIADTGNGCIKELPYAFVDPTPKLEAPAAGYDTLPVVLPATENLLSPFAPASDQSWLSIGGISNGVVSFSFAANAGPSRTAHITLLGQTISVVQGGITVPTLAGAQMMGNDLFQFSFTNTAGASFTVLTSTNLALPWSNWMVAGAATNTAPGQFQFTSQPTTNDAQRFYGVRSP